MLMRESGNFAAVKKVCRCKLSYRGIMEDDFKKIMGVIKQ